jgi:hypothetical protein
LSWESSPFRSSGWSGACEPSVRGAQRHRDVRREPFGSGSAWVCLVVSWTWALLVLVGLPRVIRAPLPAVLMGLPDLGYPLVASAVLAFGWGLARFIWAIRTMRTPHFEAPRPLAGATTDLIPATR